MKLTKHKISLLTEPGRYTDHPTLYLLVKPSGRKSWVQRITINGTRYDKGLGSWPLVSIEKARQRAWANRIVVEQGGDPWLRPARPIPTFEQAAQQYYDANIARWKQGKESNNWLRHLTLHAFPSFGTVPVDRLTRDHMLRALKKIWHTTPESARKCRAKIKAVLAWCIGNGFMDTNVMDLASGALVTIPTTTTHRRAAPYHLVPAIWKLLAKAMTNRPAVLCLQLIMATSVRKQEARLAQWSEIDLNRRVWIIPGERMKMKASYCVPLSDVAMNVLQEAKALGHATWVFPSPFGRAALSDALVDKVLRSSGATAQTTIHGFRTSFRTWAMEQTTAPREVLELCLAHKVGNATEQAYARGDLLTKRTAVMQAWGTFITTGRLHIINRPVESPTNLT